MEPSRHKKHLDKFWKICHTGFWQHALAICLRLIPVAKNACFENWGLFFWTVFKKISFFPYSLWLFIVLFVPLPPKLTMFCQKSSIFFIISSPIFKKRYGFCHFLYVFLFLVLDFLDFVFLLSFENMMLNMVCGYFVEFVECILLVLGVCCLQYMFSCLPLVF